MGAAAKCDRKGGSPADVMVRWLRLVTLVSTMLGIEGAAEIVMMGTRSWLALIGSVLALGLLAWTIASGVRTGNLVRLIRAVRSEREKPEE
jgi:hypothetical protein